jgi:amidophosphoribosyltransferase
MFLKTKKEKYLTKDGIGIFVCGILGIHGDHDISIELYYGLLALQHRGQSSVGIITYDGNIHPKKEAGLVTRLIKHYEDESAFGRDHPGEIGIGHTRYSTAGGDDLSSLERNAQPEYIVNPFIAACHNGNIYNTGDLQPYCKRTPRTVCDIQYLLLPMADGLPAYTDINFDSIVDASENLMNQLKGSYSSLFLTAGKDRSYLVALTDPYKVRPMVVGRKGDNWYVTSESMVLKRLGVEEFSDVDAGTILAVMKGEDKPVTKRVIKKRKCLCMFEYVYFADPVSWIEGISVHNSRVALGKELYKECPCEAEFVVPVPESGRRFAIGFSHESGIHLEEGLKKDRKERAFIMQTQEQRSKWAERNLSAVDAAVDGKDVVIIDDSLIRGTNIKRVIRKLRDAGAKKVHVRIGCPPIVAPCYLGIDMRSTKEFIAIDSETHERRSWEDIATEIGADSLGYSSIKALERAIKGTRDDFDLCTGCLNFPEGYPPDMREDVTTLSDKDIECGRAYE